MSKKKAKKTEQNPAKPQRATSKTKVNVKKKKKQWFERKFQKKKLQSNDGGKVQQVQPPKDAQQFSANWKILQEMLKTSQPEKKQTVTSKHKENGALRKEKARVKDQRHIAKISAGPRQTEAVKKAKQGTPPSSAIPKKSEGDLNVPAVSKTKQSTTLKRQRDNGTSNSENGAKKKKPVAEETKLTEEDIWFDDVDPDDVEATVGAEAADIMRKKQGTHGNKDTESALVKDKAFEGLTKAVAIDCEMVGVGPDGEDSILARVSLVNQFGKCIYDKHVKPTEKVTDYRTAVSGIRPEDIRDGEDVQTVQREVAEILNGRLVVGHAIHNDLKILLLDHPKKKIRDTQKYKPFRKIAKSGRPSLKVLCREVLNVKVQQGEHSSVQDAQATMRLYTLVKKQWEAEIKAKQKNKDSDKKNERKAKLPKKTGKNLMGL